MAQSRETLRSGVLVKYAKGTSKIEDVILLENKLKKSTDYTNPQKLGWKEIANGKQLEVRSKLKEVETGQATDFKFEQGVLLDVSKVIRIDGNTTGNISDALIETVNLNKYK